MKSNKCMSVWMRTTLTTAVRMKCFGNTLLIKLGDIKVKFKIFFSSFTLHPVSNYRRRERERVSVLSAWQLPKKPNLCCVFEHKWPELCVWSHCWQLVPKTCQPSQCCAHAHRDSCLEETRSLIKATLYHDCHFFLANNQQWFTGTTEQSLFLLYINTLTSGNNKLLVWQIWLGLL